ncbi:MAG: hypothetical protein RIC16_08985 [Rhodospirillales bacterium]
MYRSVCIAVIALFCLAAIGPAYGGTVRPAPPADANETQQAEYWLGAVGTILMVHCGYHSLGKKLRNVAKLSPYGQIGVKEWAGFDAYGGNCSRMKEHGDSFLENLDSYEAYFRTQYTCSGGTCVEKGVASTGSSTSRTVEIRGRDEFTEMTDARLCRWAVVNISNAESATWEDDPKYKNAVAVAKERGLTPSECSSVQASAN